MTINLLRSKKGGLGLIWCLLWAILVADSPEHQKCISTEEKHYVIEKTKEFSYKAKEKNVKQDYS